MKTEEHQMYKIGELSKIIGMSPYTIRYYDKIGIIRPASVSYNNYRYYSYDQFWKFELLKIGRQLDFNLRQQKKLVSMNKNESVIELIRCQKQKAQEKLEKYEKIVDDLTWFENQWKELSHFKQLHKIQSEWCSDRTVIYHKNLRESKEFHLTLQNISKYEISISTSVKRKYGYILNVEAFLKNEFKMEGEFLYLYRNEYDSVNQENLLSFPEGEYICTDVEVFDYKFMEISSLLEYIEQHAIHPKKVILEEIGLPLFEHRKKLLCKIMVVI